MNISALTPHPFTPTLVLYASCSIHVFPFPPIVNFYASAAYCPSPKKSKSLCQLVCVCMRTCFWIIDDNHYVSKGGKTQGNASRGGGSTVRNKDYRRPLFNKSIWELNLAIYMYKTRLHSKLMLFTCTCMRQC